MIIEILVWVIRHIGKDDRPLPPSFRRRNPIFVLPLQRNGRHPVTIEPGLIVHKYYNTDFFSDLATKMTDFVKFTLAATSGLSVSFCQNIHLDHRISLHPSFRPLTGLMVLNLLVAF